MNREESIQQVESLIEAWNLKEADLNQTDINAMKLLLEGNQQLKEQLKQRDEVIDEIANLIENTSINCDGQAEDLLGDISDILKKYKGDNND